VGWASRFLENIACMCLMLQVERPINSFPPIAMIMLSFLSLGSAITGLVGGHKWACCLDAFLVLHSIDTLCKMILVIVLWWVPQHTVACLRCKALALIR